MVAPAFDTSSLRPTSDPDAPDETVLPPLAKPDWRRGLKLSKHHFQAQDRYHEDLVRFSLRFALGERWGITRLALDEDALAAGQFVVRRLSALFPDGTPVVNATYVPPRAFDPRFRGNVYVALPLELPARAMVGSGDEHRRYVTEVAQIADYNSGRDPIPMGWLRPNLRVVFEGESLDGMSAICVARLGDPRFVPPVLQIAAAPTLRATIERIAAAGRSLRKETRHGANSEGLDVAALLLNVTLERLLPELQAAEDVHPRDAYLAASSLLGALSAFAPSGTADIPVFDLLDLQATFSAMEAGVNAIAATILAPTHHSIPLTRADENTYYASLQDPGLLGKDFMLVVCGSDPAALHSSVPRALKVTAREDLGRTIEQRLVGVPMLSEPRRPKGLALPPQSACFRLDKTALAWSSIVKHATVAIWLPAGYTHLTPLLIVKERDA